MSDGEAWGEAELPSRSVTMIEASPRSRHFVDCDLMRRTSLTSGRSLFCVVLLLRSPCLIPCSGFLSISTVKTIVTNP